MALWQYSQMSESRTEADVMKCRGYGINYTFDAQERSGKVIIKPEKQCLIRGSNHLAYKRGEIY